MFEGGVPCLFFRHLNCSPKMAECSPKMAEHEPYFVKFLNSYEQLWFGAVTLGLRSKGH